MSELNRKNLEGFRRTGITASFSINDSTDLPLNFTGYSFALEVMDSDGISKFILDVPESAVEGLVIFRIEPEKLAKLYAAQYEYTLTLTPATGPSFVAYTGLITATGTAAPYVEPVVLPDGSVYVTSPTRLTFGTWYATNSFYRLQVTGIGVMTVDGRDLTGNITGNLDTYQALVLDTNVWRPTITGMNAFRLKQVAGNNVVTYLP